MATATSDINFREAPEGASADASADAQVIVNNQPRVVPPTNYTLSAPDLSARRYGEKTLNSTVDSAPAPSEKHINWGGIIKGVLIVSAVVVAAVVVTPIVTHAAAGALTWLSTSPVFGPIISGLHTAAIYSGEFISHLAGHAWAALAPAASGGAGHYVASQAVTAAIPSISNGFGLFAGGATLVGGLAAAAPTLSHIHAVDPTVTASALPQDGGVGADVSSILAAKKSALIDAAGHSSAAGAAHHASDLAHHASDHENHDRRSRSALAQAQQASRSWTDRPDIAAKAASAKAAVISQRTGGFAEQVDADAAKLNAALADPVR